MLIAPNSYYKAYKFIKKDTVKRSIVPSPLHHAIFQSLELIFKADMTKSGVSEGIESHELIDETSV